MAETKKEFHLWFLPEYEQEEEYLRAMHNQGWRFTRVARPCVYTFEKCPPEDVVYKLDFRPLRGENKDAFLRIYRDYGWEYLQDLNDYSYFRKPAADAAPEDLDIFSDDESRLDMVRRILRWRVPLISLFFLFVLLQSYNLLTRTAYDTEDVALAVFYILILALYVYLISRCAVGFRRLWRKYSHKSES